MTMEEVLILFPAYHEAHPSLKQEMLRQGKLVHLPHGFLYFQEGDRCEQLAWVGSGKLRVFKTNPSGRELTLYDVREGEICTLNLCCLISGHPCPANAQVEIPVDAVVFPEQVFHDWIREYPPFRSYVFGLLAGQVASMMSLVGEIAFNKMDRRLADYLQSKFGVGGEGQGQELSITHERIATDLGTAREVVSRLLKEFERQGAIRLSRGHIHLEDSGALGVLGSTN